MAKNGTQSSATATATTPTTHTVVVCFELNAEPVLSVAPPQVAVNPGDIIAFTLAHPNHPEAVFRSDPALTPGGPLVSWGRGDTLSAAWQVRFDGEDSTKFSMRAPDVDEYGGVFTYTIAVVSGEQVYYASDPTIVNEPPAGT